MSIYEGVRPQRFPRYDGEDTEVTTKKELMGWYAYAFGAEVFAVCGVGRLYLCGFSASNIVL